MQFKLKSNDGGRKSKSLSCTNFCIPTSPPITSFLSFSVFTFCPLCPSFFLSRSPKGCFVTPWKPHSLHVCVCVCVWWETLAEPQIRVLRWKNKGSALGFHSTLFSSGSSCLRADRSRGQSVCRCVPLSHSLKFWSLFSLCFTVHKEVKDLTVIKVVSSRGYCRGGSWGCSPQCSGPRFDWAHCICCTSVPTSPSGFLRLENSRNTT